MKIEEKVKLSQFDQRNSQEAKYNTLRFLTLQEPPKNSIKDGYYQKNETREKTQKGKILDLKSIFVCEGTPSKKNLDCLVLEIVPF